MAKSTLPASEGKAAATVDDQTKEGATDWDKWFKANEDRLAKIESVLHEVQGTQEKDGQRIDALAKAQPKLSDKSAKGDEARFSNIERMLGIPHSPGSEAEDDEATEANK